MHEQLAKQPQDSLKMSDLHEEETERRLRELTSPQEWGKVVSEIVAKIVKNPDWLISEEVFPEYQVEFNIRLLLKIRQTEVSSLEDISPLSGDKQAVYAFVMRFLEQFSIDHNFPYIWRGGDIKDTVENCTGSYTFLISQAEERVIKSYGRVRENPVLIRLNVQTVVNAYKKNSAHKPIEPEHDYDGIFAISFELNLTGEHPEGLTTFSI